MSLTLQEMFNILMGLSVSSLMVVMTDPTEDRLTRQTAEIILEAHRLNRRNYIQIH